MKLGRTNTKGRVSCLGPAGSFSELAARKLCPNSEVVLMPSFALAVKELNEGRVDFCVLPVENSLNGAVLANLDLLEREEIFGVEELMLPIDHRLATLAGVSLEDVRFVYSHEQAIGQCGAFLRTHLPQAQYIYTSSTAESLEKLDAHAAGIVGAHVQRAGVKLSSENIADNSKNVTRFMRIVRRGELPKKSNKIFFCAVCAHKPGALFGLLRIFADYGFDLTRIESRPVKESFGEYRFFIEIAGDLKDEKTRRALEDAAAYCRQFKLLGAY